jgi:hypothetical protein
MRYYIDCEFDGHNGPMLSMAVVGEGGHSLYMTICADVLEPWVRDNVLPLLDSYGDVDLVAKDVHPLEVGTWLRRFFGDEDQVTLIADSPVDIGRFCQALTTGEHGGWVSVDFSRMTFEVHNVDCYPTTLPGAVQHNAWWDAMALREKLKP